MHERRRARFRSQYDGRVYQQASSLDPRLLIPGVMIVVISVPLLLLTWPIVTPLMVTCIGVTLVCLGFAKRNRFTVSPDGYCFSWSLGPLGWTVRVGAHDTTPILAAGRLGTYQIKFRRGLRKFDPFIEAASRHEAEAWRAFFINVTQGASAVVPKKDAAWTLDESE